MSPRNEARRCDRCGGRLSSAGSLSGQCPYCLLKAGLEDASDNGEAAGLEDSVRKLLVAGFEIGPYRLEMPLGGGGMGQVYRAVDTRLDRRTALKFLTSSAADVDGRRRFQREAQMASSLNHPHIITVYDVGEFDGLQYLVTEFIDGGTLTDWALLRKREPREIVELLAGVADALATAHEAGILHRDIKPANILVTRSGHAKVADFGLAKPTGAGGDEERTQAVGEALTRPGVIVGTTAYMSPEQALGRPIDTRSDIFSFGVLLYELLAGCRPFDGATHLEMMQAIAHAEPDPLDEEVPLMLRMMVEKALDKEPRDRYQSMREIAVDLRRFLKTKSVEPLPAATKTRRHLVLPWVAVGFVLLGTAIWEAVRPPSVPQNLLEGAHFIRVTDFESSDAAISPDGRFVAFVSDHDGPFDVWLAEVGVGREINLTHGNVSPLPGPLRSVGFSGDGSEIWLGGGDLGMRVRLLPLTGGTPRNFLGEETANVAWSPEGSRLVYHTFGNGDPLFVADRNGANARKIFSDRPGIHNHFPTWSPDGRWIYFAHGTPATREMELWRISPDGGIPQRLMERKADVAYPTPVGSGVILYIGRDADGSGPWLWAFDIKRNTSRRVSFGLEQYTSIGASADGNRLVATIGRPKASLWRVPILDRVAEEHDVEPVMIPSVRALAPRFGGPSLFYLSSLGTGDGLWRYRNGQVAEVWKGANDSLLETPAVSPGGEQVAIVLRRNSKEQLHVLSADGAELRLIASGLDIQGAPCWSPDGHWIVTGGSDASGPGLFKIPVEGGSPLRLTIGLALNPVWSPGGDLIVYAGSNVRTFAPLLAVRPDGSEVKMPAINLRRLGERVRFSADGKRLLYMQGLMGAQDFWELDLATMKSRPLTNLQNHGAMRTFDVTPDGKHIVFDRLRENSDVVVIDLPRK